MKSPQCFERSEQQIPKGSSDIVTAVAYGHQRPTVLDITTLVSLIDRRTATGTCHHLSEDTFSPSLMPKSSQPNKENHHSPSFKSRRTNEEVWEHWVFYSLRPLLFRILKRKDTDKRIPLIESTNCQTVAILRK